ncbi:MAG: molybdopterin-dependent oxidoreductase [Planctomycetes bacterium]|nr:molybdopterin-dependent oxidoreductase [Planctomycetota bacterium]
MTTETKRTLCNRDCPDACGLVATIEDGRLVRLGGDPDHPVTRGFICSRTSRFPERQNSPERLLTPLLRRGGGGGGDGGTAGGFTGGLARAGVLEPASWDEALSTIADTLLRIRGESGPAAILHYRSGGSLGLLKAVVDYFFELLGPVSVKRGDICSGGGDAAQETDFGDEESHDLFDLAHARSILLWGKNPTVSNIHLLPFLRDAKRRGACLLLIDPIHHKTEALADRWIAPRPGGDFHLALGAAAVLFARGAVDPGAASWNDHFAEFRALALSRDAGAWAREAGVSEAEVGLVADALAARPCSIQVGWGMARRTNGSAIVRALDALASVSGNLGIPGGGVSYYFKRRGAYDTSFLSKRPPRTLSEPLLGQELLNARDPAVRAVWVTAGNPVAMLPDSTTVARAFESREFVVVVDSFVTDTARRATVVLPTTTLVEDDDLHGAYGHHWLGVSTPVLAPPPGVLSDLEIVQRLAAAVDARTSPSEKKIAPLLAGSARDWKRRLLRRVEPLGVTVDALEGGAKRNPLAPRVLFEGRRFPTDTGRMNLVHDFPPEPPEEPGFPLWLFSNSTERAQSSQWAGAPPDLLPAACHPATATTAGLADGDEAWLESALGRLRVRVRFDDRQRRDVVLVPKGGHFDRGASANALIRARLTDAGEGAAYLDCRVRLAPAR